MSISSWAEILEKDLQWREAELVSMKRLAIVNCNNEIIYLTTLRAAWSLLYAHFEGFTKFCWDLLLDQIQKENIKIHQLNDKFQLLALEKQFRQIKSNLSGESLMKFFTSDLPNEFSQYAKFPSDCRLETDSNLWPNVFDDECLKIGIISKVLDENRRLIKTLVARRNEIAHGKSMTITSVTEYTEYEQATLLVLHDLAIQLVELIESKSYIK